MSHFGLLYVYLPSIFTESNTKISAGDPKPASLIMKRLPCDRTTRFLLVSRKRNWLTHRNRYSHKPNQSVFLSSAPDGFDSRHPARLRKRLWSQRVPEPLIYLLERATGIEPASSAWKAGVLPLNYARKIWSGRQDLNLRHPAPKAGALPNCATSRRC